MGHDLILHLAVSIYATKGYKICSIFSSYTYIAVHPNLFHYNMHVAILYECALYEIYRMDDWRSSHCHS